MEESESKRLPCPRCGSTHVQKCGRTRGKFGAQRYQCQACKSRYSDGDDKDVGAEPTAMSGDGVLAAAQWVAENMTLKGERLRAAKKRASGMALTLLESVHEDPAFKRTFLNTMIPRLFLNEKKLEEESQNKRETKLLLDQIDKMIEVALRESNRPTRNISA